MMIKLEVWCEVCKKELTLSTLNKTVECRCGEETVSDIMDEEEYLPGWDSAYLRDAITELNEG